MPVQTTTAWPIWLVNFWDFLVSAFLSFVLPIIYFIVVVAIGWWLAKYVCKLLRKTLDKAQIDSAAASFICSVSRVVLVIISIIVASGDSISTMATALGAAGLTASFALQGSLSNFVSGMQLIFAKPFKNNDFLSVGEHSGSVKQITVLSTTLVTIDNKEIVIPNSMMTTDVVVNFTSQETRRLDLSYSVSYGINTDIPKKIIADILSANEMVITEPEPLIAVGAHNDSSVEIVAKVWVKSDNYWPLYFHMQEEVKKKFDENSVEIPFPQLDVHTK